MMPRYQQGKDWVEIAGAAERSMGELQQMYGLDEAKRNAVLTELITDAQFIDRHGAAFDPRADGYDRLTLQQYDWLRAQVYQAARDEVLDPEV